MAKIVYNVFEIDADSLSRFRYFPDSKLEFVVQPVTVPTTFTPGDNFIELTYFTLDNVRLSTIPNYTNYSILSGGQRTNLAGTTQISIDPLEDYKAYYGDTAEVKALYNFLKDPFRNEGQNQSFYIESISSDRREARLVASNLDSLTVEQKVNTLINRFNQNTYSVDLHLFTQANSFYSCINVNSQPFRGTTAVLLRFAEPLPISIQAKDIVTIVEKISDSIAFEINTTITPDKPVIPTLRSANFNVEVDTQTTEPSQYFNYNELFSFPTTNTYREINSLFNEKGAAVSVDYSDFSNFINFSSAEERLRNFEYKLQLIESYQSSLDSINTNLPSYTGTGISGSREYFEGLINGVLHNFDHYERHLFYESGSTSWPKGNDSRPYVNVGTATGAGTTWFNAEVSDAILYDAQNPDLLTNTVPAYLKEDTDNRPYELFIHMVAQHFDNLWLYTNAVSEKYDNDNRLNRGVSKDLVEDLLKNFGVKLYTSNRSAQDLFRYFTVNSYEIDDLEPNIDIITTGSASPVSQNDYQKEIYKRIYHNLPLLMKSKGTERGLRALINCFGIPSDTLKIRIYGGQSSEDLPFFGGQQAFTGSLDKVRLNNTGSIVEGNTVSQYTSVLNLDNFFTQDLHNIEVGFSPTHNIDTYILSQSAALFPDTPFDIDDYIGDPREISTNTYFSLRDYADTIFAGVNSYDLKDFVRFIKFFDNVIFRMVRDFIPARVVADTGIIIKPHLLERSKYKAPVMSWTQPEYTGSINTAFITGSSGGVYESYAAGSVSGSLSTSYTERVQTPLGKRVKRWVGSNLSISYNRAHEEAKFDGQLSGSNLLISDGELNRDNPYKELYYSKVLYDVRFLKDVPTGACLIQSLGSSTSTPYVVRPSENPYDLSSLFLNANLAAFNYTVNGGAPRNPGAYNFDFGAGEQYSLETIAAASGALCTATTYAIKVVCDASISATIPQTYVYTDLTYNLTNFFIQNSNSANSILVNGSPVTIEQGLLEYNFTGTEGDLVDVRFQDSVDSNCFIERTFTILNCSLDYKQPPIITLSGGKYYYVGKSAFASTNPDTNYKVTINCIGNSGAAVAAGPYDVVTLNANGEPLIEVDPEDLAETYRNAYPGFDAFYSQLSEGASALKTIAITATNSQLCADGTPNINLIPTAEVQIEEFVARSMRYNPSSYVSACGTVNNQVTVYVSPYGRNVPDASQILENGVIIYSDITGTTLAPSGFYSNAQPNAPAGFSEYRYWDSDLQLWSGTEPISCP